MKERAGLLFVNVIGRVERFPCLIVDRSQDGFELSVGCGLQQGQLVDLILEEDLSKPKTVLAQALEGLESSSSPAVSLANSWAGQVRRHCVVKLRGAADALRRSVRKRAGYETMRQSY